MNLFHDLGQEPYRFDFFDVLRQFERLWDDKPRIGDSETLEQEFVLLGQEPWLEFPGSNLANVSQDRNRRYRLSSRFLGLLGPQGALPLATTDEARHWYNSRDESFARFLDIFNHRFLQLFFRAWADARPIAQHDRPDADRFADYVGTAVGLGTRAYKNRDSVPDYAKLALSGLLSSKVKSASRLKNAVAHLFGVRVEVNEFVGTWLVIEPGDRLKLGGHGSGLGREAIIGSSTYSITDKFRIEIFARDLDEFERFLPSGQLCDRLADIVFFYLGDLLSYDVQLSLPKRAIRPARLSSFGRLGWTSWMAKPPDPDEPGIRSDARFHPAEQARLKRKNSSASKP